MVVRAISFLATLVCVAEGLHIPPPCTRRGALAALACAPLAFSGANSAAAAPKPTAMDAAVALEAATPANKRNAAGEPGEHVPKISFQSGKVVFSVPHETLSLPNHVDAYTEAMWLRDADSGKILAAKLFRGTGDGSIPSPTLEARVASGTRVAAMSKCSRHGMWQGSFRVP